MDAAAVEALLFPAVTPEGVAAAEPAEAEVAAFPFLFLAALAFAEGDCIVLSCTFWGESERDVAFVSLLLPLTTAEAEEYGLNLDGALEDGTVEGAEVFVFSAAVLAPDARTCSCGAAVP